MAYIYIYIHIYTYIYIYNMEGFWFGEFLLCLLNGFHAFLMILRLSCFFSASLLKSAFCLSCFGAFMFFCVRAFLLLLFLFLQSCVSVALLFPSLFFSFRSHAFLCFFASFLYCLFVFLFLLPYPFLFVS